MEPEIDLPLDLEKGGYCWVLIIAWPGLSHINTIQVTQNPNEHVKPSSSQPPTWAPEWNTSSCEVHLLCLWAWLEPIKNLLSFSQRVALLIEFIVLVLCWLQSKLKSVGRFWIPSRLNRCLQIWTASVWNMLSSAGQRHLELWDAAGLTLLAHILLVLWTRCSSYPFPSDHSGADYLVSKRKCQLEEWLGRHWYLCAPVFIYFILMLF